LEALEKSGSAGNTLVLFSSDNGFAPYSGAKELEAHGHYPSGPLRGYKADVWEGGHRIPFIVRWPGVVKAGAVSGQLVHHADLMATLAEIVEHSLPDNAGEDSFSFVPLLKGVDKPVRQHAISHASSGIPSLRLGAWKFIAGAAGGGYDDKGKSKSPSSAAATQLYNLADDLGETKNLVDEKPDLAAEMTALMDKLVTEGRSTPGAPQANDVPVKWRRFMDRAKP
ncbi:MAG: sulfatase-like hydrolase/transferase, partial [Prosthecobacter sp.]|nr:sulfatase-like hydrolase/transferase [Prosthecobacter sp.]